MNKDEIVKDLLDKIKREEIPSGHWLVERDLCEMYGISRTPVREILRDLAATGLVELQPSRGYRVMEFGLEKIVQLFAAREAVEGMATRLACQVGDEMFFNYIENLRNALRAADVQAKPDAGVELGRDLHERIIEVSHNPILGEFYVKLQHLTDLTRNITGRYSSIEESSRLAHLEILDAITARDPDRGEEAMRKHLRETYEGLIETFLTTRGGFGKSPNGSRR